MIKLFITDIDGCLLEPMQTPDWELLGKIKSLNEQSRHDPSIPGLTICTGRPMPYVEAVAQIMGITRPVIFESAGVFQPEGYRIAVDGSFDDYIAGDVSHLKRWLKEHIIPKFKGMTPEFSKLMDAGLIHPDEDIIRQALPRVRTYVEQHYPLFEVHSTEVSINVVLKKNNKKAGIQKLCSLMELELEEVAFIGDSSGDIPGLKKAGKAFAPRNAVDEVKKISTVIDAPSTQAVLTAIRQVTQANRRLASPDF